VTLHTRPPATGRDRECSSASWSPSESARFFSARVVYAKPGQILAILGAALLIVLIGVADDIWDLDWLTKLAGQFHRRLPARVAGVADPFIPIPVSS